MDFTETLLKLLRQLVAYCGILLIMWLLWNKIPLGSFCRFFDGFYMLFYRADIGIDLVHRSSEVDIRIIGLVFELSFS